MSTEVAVEGATPPHKNSLSLVDPTALVNAMHSNDQSTAQQTSVTKESTADVAPQPSVTTGLFILVRYSIRELSRS